MIPTPCSQKMHRQLQIYSMKYARPFEPSPPCVKVPDQAVSAKPESKGRWIDILCKLSRSHGVRPKSCSPSGVTLSGEKPYKAVGSVEVWKGKQGENQVCVKAFQLLGPGADGTKQVCSCSLPGRMVGST